MTREVYYHRLDQALRDYLKQVGPEVGIARLLSALYCAYVDVRKELEDESKKASSTA